VAEIVAAIAIEVVSALVLALIVAAAREVYRRLSAQAA
jgi:hypothetical protein